MGEYFCSICSDKPLARAIDEELGKPGASGAFVARLMTARGFPVGAPLVNSHHKHAVVVPAGVARGPRDMAMLVRDKGAEMFEAGKLDLTKRKHAAGIGLALKAQGELNKVAARVDKTDALLAVARMFAGGFLPIPETMLIDDGIIDGESHEVEDAELDAMIEEASHP